MCSYLASSGLTLAQAGVSSLAASKPQVCNVRRCPCFELAPEFSRVRSLHGPSRHEVKDNQMSRPARPYQPGDSRHGEGTGYGLLASGLPSRALNMVV